MIKAEKSYSPKEMARLISCHIYFVRREITEGRIAPVFKINTRVIRIPASTVASYLKSHAS